MTVIGVFGPETDDEARAVARRLRDRGCEVWPVDLSRYPAQLHLTFQTDGAHIDGRPVLDMAAAFLRKSGVLGHPRLHPLEPTQEPEATWRAAHAETAALIRTERRDHALRSAALEWLAARRPVINPLVANNLHRLKVALLDRLRRAGLPVPAFAVGSDADALADAATRMSRRWAGAVTKPLAGVYKTHLVDEERLRAHPWGRRPALHQRFIPGDTVRCYVVDGRLLTAARIVHGGTVDSSLSQTGIEVLTLPPAAREVAEGTARTLGLAFCGMDLMREAATDRWFIIDCNLSPMFVNYGKLSRCDVAGHLADLLLARARHRDGSRRAEVFGLVGEAKSLLAHDPEIARRLARRRRQDDHE